MDRIFFTADLHFGHAGVLKYMPDRPFSDRTDTELHDKWLSDLWSRTVDSRDVVYILGDFAFLNEERKVKLLKSLPGQKVLIQGNHDKNIGAVPGRFSEIRQIMDLKIRQSRFPFLGHSVRFTLCHYPMLTWNHKPQGGLMLHGHSHGRLDNVNRISPDLRWDVGIDGELSRMIGRANGDGFALVDIETLYDVAVMKAGGTDFREYVQRIYLNETSPEIVSACIPSL